MATASFGLPDLALTTLTEVAEETRRITAATQLPLLVDADTGWGPPLMVERAVRELERAGADIIFAEGAGELRQYTAVAEATGVPVLANLTEFGVTPLFTSAELGAAGVSLALYPLSAFRAMSAAALRVFTAIRSDGTQAAVLPEMQTRAELYDILGYEAYERRADEHAAGTGSRPG